MSDRVHHETIEDRRGEADEGTVVRSRRSESYILRIALTDAVALALAVGVAYLLRFDANGTVRVEGDFSPTYLSLSVVLLVAWFAGLVLGRTYDHRIIGAGPTEFQRVWSASWHLGAIVAIVSYMFRMDIARGYLGFALPLGLIFVFVSRTIWRRWLRRQRATGLLRSRVLVVGHLRKAAGLIDELAATPSVGFTVIGACVPAGDAGTGRFGAVEVLGTMDDAAKLAVTHRADMVAVVGSDEITADALSQLGWDLEGSGIDIAFMMSMRDVSGPRVTMQPVNGLPLVYVDEPRFSGFKYALKSVMDWLMALVILTVISPVLLVIALLVKFTSKGDIFYRQERVGVRGKTFKMIKFRSMDANAHSRLAEALAAEGVTDVGLFYKPKNDSRVTPVGRVLRKYSLDELPQLINVLRGEMSLVGPRPQIDKEVAQYDRKAHRRLLVKPGLTGLWQVSGRSELSPEEGIRMDVFYVENWTIFGDFLILARTAKAMVVGEGAY